MHQIGFPRMQEGVRWGTPIPSSSGLVLYSTAITRPSNDLSKLLRLYSISSYTLLTLELSRDLLREGLEDEESESSLSLHPSQPQDLHPPGGINPFLLFLGIWHTHLLPLLDDFLHFLQHRDFFPLFSSFLPSLGLYSGSSPLAMQSSMEQPLHPQPWHPSSSRLVLRWLSGTTHTQDFLPFSVCLHFRQQYLYRLLSSFSNLPLKESFWSFKISESFIQIYYKQIQAQA